MDDIDLTHLTPQSDSLRNAIDLNNLVFNISTLSSIEGDNIGVDGRKSTQPDYSHQLAMWADTNQLVKLTNHEKPIVRVLAFGALLEKKYTRIKDIFISHLSDEATCNFYSGCMIDPVPVNIIYYQVVSSWLTLKENQYYKKLLINEYKNTGFWWKVQYL